MTILVPFLVALHVLASVFWAGSTFVLARTSAAGIETLARPQLGSAFVTIAAGAILMGLAHAFSMSPFGYVLASGIIAALVALGIQISALPMLQRLGAAPEADKSRLRSRLAIAQRIAALCLAITVTCMVLARYA